MTSATALLAAAIPTAIYTMLIWWLDRYEKEPLWLLIVAFLWGSLPAIALAILLELTLAQPLAGSVLGPHTTVWGIVPPIEETIKALALIGLFLFAHREFDGPLDGIVYGALVGFGFSMTENVLYFAHDASNMDRLFWVRGVLFGMNHAFFSSMVGLALGVVRNVRSRWRRLIAFSIGLTAAILFHALHNAAVSHRLPGIFFSWMIQSGGVLVVLAVAVLAWRHERRWIATELDEEVRDGLITRADYFEIMSPSRRVRRQLGALLTQGWSAYRRVRMFHHLATKLAFCKAHLSLGDTHHTCDDRDRLRREISALQAELHSKESHRLPHSQELEET